MKNLVKTTKLFLILFLAVCVQKTNLNAMATLQELCAEQIVKNIDKAEFIEGLISGKSDTLKFLENVCEAPRARQAFVSTLLPDFFVLHRVSKWFEDPESLNKKVWSPDCTKCASIDFCLPGIIRIWNTTTREARILADDKMHIASLVWNLDGTRLAGWAFDEPIRIWNVITGECKIIESRMEVNSVALNHDGSMIVIGTYDGRVSLWDVQKAEEVIIFTGHKDKVCSVTWSSDGKYFSSVDVHGFVKIWNVNEMQCIHEFKCDLWSIDLAMFSSDGKVLALAGLLDKIIELRDLGTGKDIQFRGKLGDICSIAWSPDGKYIASRSFNEKIRLWNIKTGERETFVRCQGLVKAMAWNLDGLCILSSEVENDGRLMHYIKRWRNITDLNQVLLILVLQYLYTKKRINEFYDIVNLPHLNTEGGIIQLISAWFDFNPIEQRYLKQEFGIDGV
jgi:hypothetical protein